MQIKLKSLLLVAPYKGPQGIKDMFVAPNFGLYRIKGYLESRYSRARVDVVNPNIERINFKTNKYDYIGFSLTHNTLEHDLGLIYRARKDSPDSQLLAGGIEATFIPDRLLKESPIDGVVLGEGEEVLEKILHKRERSLDHCKAIPGLVTRKSIKSRKIIFGKPLDKKTFSAATCAIDFSRIPYSKFWKANASQYMHPDPLVINSVRIFTSNYCPYNCNFCSATNFLDYSYLGSFSRKKTTKVVHLSAADTINMIIRIIAAHPKTKTIIFDDDTFILSSAHVSKVVELIIAAKEKKKIPEELTFICQARIDNFKSDNTKEVLALMKKAGFRMIMYGVESFSNDALSDLGKNTDASLISDVLRSTMRSGITPLVYIILFTPHSKKEDILRSVLGSLDCLSKGMEVSINLFVMDLPGCHYQKESGLSRFFRSFPVRIGTREVFRIRKSEFIYPADTAMRNLSRKIERDYQKYEALFKRKFGIRHMPGRVYSYIVLYSILDMWSMDKEKNKLLTAFRDYSV